MTIQRRTPEIADTHGGGTRWRFQPDPPPQFPSALAACRRLRDPTAVRRPVPHLRPEQPRQRAQRVPVLHRGALRERPALGLLGWGGGLPPSQCPLRCAAWPPTRLLVAQVSPRPSAVFTHMVPKPCPQQDTAPVLPLCWCVGCPSSWRRMAREGRLHSLPTPARSPMGCAPPPGKGRGYPWTIISVVFAVGP